MSEFNLRIPGWDGTALAADAHLPDPAHWPVPTVVTRTPYGRTGHLAEGRGWTARGFAYVVQDVRGRYDSDGVWECYRNERGDGAALADWIAAQPWSDGHLIGYGGSYSGYTAWALAAERPERVPALVSLGPSMAMHRTKFEGGVLRLAEHAAWWLARADGRTSRDDLVGAVFHNRPELLAHLPVVELPEAMGVRLPGFREVIEAGPYARPDQEITERELAALPVAGLHVGGWYDLLAEETFRLWRQVGTALPQRPPQQLVVGPWGHDLAFAGRTAVGDREHGPESLLDLGGLAVTWIRDVLAGRATSGTRVFHLAADVWEAWPEQTTTDTLHAHRDGTLQPVTAMLGAFFTHDPEDPYPTLPPGADRRTLDARPDALRFVTDRQDGRTVIGASVELDGSAPVADVDWVVRLVEVTADGRAFDLGRGCARGTGPHRIPLSPFAVTPGPGSRLRLEISGADFPRLARSLGTGADRYTTTRTAPVRQTVHTAALHLELS
ncbi:CocE/NonD family hydrolase [Acrocarpospora catenulata]|uniref:CocE/NonD family hydrolase n=1 Tax=Acrocarpospora catenulata TaxID=2836182 RepID=UPI001BD9358B|nr:CocE/NonD family hydrolase [Acrocarpospora catenulata]